jgi:hypothetical protein
VHRCDARVHPGLKYLTFAQATLANVPPVYRDAHTVKAFCEHKRVLHLRNIPTVLRTVEVCRTFFEEGRATVGSVPAHLRNAPELTPWIRPKSRSYAPEDEYHEVDAVLARRWSPSNRQYVYRVRWAENGHTEWVRAEDVNKHVVAALGRD